MDVDRFGYPQDFENKLAVFRLLQGLPKMASSSK